VNILVVDDEPALLESMRSYLSRLGHNVTAFRGADSAWDCFSADPTAYSVMIVDLTLTGVSGEELIRRVLDRVPDLPILATSGYPDSLRHLEQSAPGVAVLEKPFTPRMLTEALERVIGRQGATGT
jgi:DNA-binding NtrC family response regulator